MSEYINREEFLQELVLRERIRDLVVEAYGKRATAENLKEEKLRGLIKKIISEAAEDIAPHHNTGINVLADLLKKIVPQLEDEYKLLTTDPEQRESFRAHIINATQNALAAPRVMDQEDEDVVMPEEINIQVDAPEAPEPAGDEEKFIDIDDTPEVPEEEEEDTFGLEGEDETGRNFAQRAFDKVEKQIIEAYELLSNEEDKNLFFDYLLTNLKMYFDKFEDELKSSLPEPTTDEYEAEEAGEEQD